MTIVTVPDRTAPAMAISFIATTECEETGRDVARLPIRLKRWSRLARGRADLGWRKIARSLPLWTISADVDMSYMHLGLGAGTRL